MGKAEHPDSLPERAGAVDVGFRPDPPVIFGNGVAFATAALLLLDGVPPTVRPERIGPTCLAHGKGTSEPGATGRGTENDNRKQ